MRPQILHKDSKCTRKSTDNHYQRFMMIYISPNSFKNYENQAHLLSDGTKKFRSRIIVVFASSNRHDHKLQVHFDRVRQMDKANFTIWRYFFRFDNFSNRNKKVEVKLLTNSKRFHVLHTILRRGDKHWALLTLPGVYRFSKKLVSQILPLPWQCFPRRPRTGRRLSSHQNKEFLFFRNKFILNLKFRRKRFFPRRL